MDYQNGLLFPGQQQNQQFFTSPSPVPHAQPPSSAAGLYPDPQTRFSQQAAQAQYNLNGPGGFPLPPGGNVASGGAMMQAAALAQQQQPRGPPQVFYTSAPYSQGTPTSAAIPTPQFAQPTKTFSPPNHASPYASPANAQQVPHSESLPSTPMAGKIMTQPQPAQGTPQGAARSVPQSPISTEAQAREKERVTLLLEINAELLQEMTSLQSQGKGGYTGVPPTANPEAGKPPEMKPASKEYIEILRRLQANLSYLATTAERAQKPNQPIPPGPAIMIAPSTPQAVVELYAKLQALFPGWKGQPVKQSPGVQQRPGLPQTNSQGSPHNQMAASTES